MTLERFSDFARMVNAQLELLVPQESVPPDPIHAAIRYSLFAGGKRLRPILCLAACESLNENPEKVLPIAAAIEMVHTYSLVHDDLPCMDNDDIRRGKPTNHKVFGEAIAVLTGDALLTMAMEVLSSSNYQAAIRSRLINMLTKAAGTYGMIGGQVLDMVSSNTILTQQQLENLHSMKTAALIRFACMSAPVALESGSKVEEAFGEYGNFIGLAFQIVDDILDIEGTTESLGKTAGKDRKHQKVTYPSLIGIDKSRELAEDFVGRACQIISPYDPLRYLRTVARHILEREK
jgi:geranylgeranyl diphosphate synthase, type II